MKITYENRSHPALKLNKKRNSFRTTLLSIFVLLCGLMFNTHSYAVAYNIFPKIGTLLPTSIPAGQTVKAFYTVANNTRTPLLLGSVRSLPPFVSQNIFNPVFPDTCPFVFNLLPGWSCTLELTISGPVSLWNSLLHPLLICNPFLPACAGTLFPLNVALVSPPPSLTTLTVIPSSASILIGQTQQYRAIGTYSDNSQVDLTTSVTWTSSNPNVATIGINSGLATGIARTQGIPVILTATLGSLTGSATLLVKQEVAYITSFGTNQVFMCNVDSSIGALSNCTSTGSNFIQPQALTLNEAGTFAYIANNTPTNNAYVILCSIDPTTLLLTNCASTGPAFMNLWYVALNPTNTQAYISNYTANQIQLCSVTAANGQLGNCIPTGSGFQSPTYTVINTANTIAYVANQSSNSISKCLIDSLGQLTSCTPTAGGFSFQHPYGIALNSSNTQAYITSLNSGGAVILCSIDSSGNLVNCAQTGPLFSGHPEGISLALNTLGTMIYITNSGGNYISVCSINSSTGQIVSCQQTGPSIAGPVGIDIGTF